MYYVERCTMLLFREFGIHFCLMKRLHFFFTLCKFTFAQWSWHSRRFLKKLLPVEGKQVITVSHCSRVLVYRGVVMCSGFSACTIEEQTA